MARKNLNDDLNRFYGKGEDQYDRDFADRTKGQKIDPPYGDASAYENVNSTPSNVFSMQKIDDFKGKNPIQATYERCHQSHPPLPLPGTDKVIYGGACSNPTVHDADVYIGFDYGMSFSERSWPWKKGIEFRFTIPDMGIPPKPEEFDKMLSWTKAQIDAGKKVFCGCIGGHGRTGMFLAALCKLYGETDAIAYVRKHYCKKAVESKAQVDFLHKRYGITKVEGYKEIVKGPAKSSGWGQDWHGDFPAKTTKKKSKVGTHDKVTPIKGNGSIW